jgi:putative flippase GtrA
LTTAPLRLHHRLLYYAAIGGLAALTHVFIVFQLVSRITMHPLIANIIGFLVAFNVSYFGHKHMTFSRLKDEKELRLMHFFLVACSAGLLNELLYFLILRFTSLNYILALLVVLGSVSIYSFLVARFWACR